MVHCAVILPDTDPGFQDFGIAAWCVECPDIRSL